MGTARFRARLAIVVSCVTLLPTGEAAGAKFGINFQGGAYDQWGSYYVNQVGGYGAGPYASAFGVAAANWYEPGADIANTDELPGAPTSVNFDPASMGSGSVNIGFTSNRGVDGNGYNVNAYGFSRANRYFTVDTNPMDGNPDTYLAINNPDPTPDQVWYVLGTLDPATNGIPISGEHAVWSGNLWGTEEDEYGPDWVGHDIVVTISGLQSIASGYRVTLLAAAPDFVVEAFTPAQLSDSAANTDGIDFEVVQRASYWSPGEYPDNPGGNPFLSPGATGTSDTTFTGDTLTIRLSGANEYFNGNAEAARTALAGVIVEYFPHGDYNTDGKVDAADYVLWRNDPDLFGGSPGGYNTWRNNFGVGVASGSSLTPSQVPEPGFCITATMLAVVFLGRRRRR